MSMIAHGGRGTSPSPTISSVVLETRMPSRAWFIDVTTSMSGNTLTIPGKVKMPGGILIKSVAAETSDQWSFG